MRARELPDPMGIRKSALAAAALLTASLVLPTPLHAQEPNLYFHPHAWLADLSGTGYTGGGGGIRDFDIEESFDLDTGRTVPSFEFFLRSGKNRFIIGWNRGSYEGSGRLSSPIDFAGRVFPAASGGGSTLHTEFDYDIKQFIYGRPFFDSKTVAAGFLLGVDTYRIESDLRMSGICSEDVSVNSSLPTFGAYITYYPVRTVRLYAQARGMSLDRGNVDSRLLDWYGVVEYLFIGQSFALSVGYRSTDLEAEEDRSTRFDLKQKGVFTGFVIKF